MVLLVVLIARIIYRNADAAQKQRVKTASKVIIALWVLVSIGLHAHHQKSLPYLFLR